MRSIALMSAAVVAFISMAPVASAATRDSAHRVQPGSNTAYGITLPAPTAGYPQSELWPHCSAGLECTAAGYPNLHYWHEMQGLPN
jgi:hypothetical protein